MKKTLLIVACMLAATSFAFAQSSATNYYDKSGNRVEYKHPKFHGTVMSRPNKVDYGFFYGYGGKALANTGGLVLDINCMNNNYRTRIALEGLERWYWGGVSVQAQYLIPVVGGLYFYPSVGVRGEVHNVDHWREDYCEKKGIAYDPEAEWGPGSWGIGGEVGGGLEYQFCPYVALYIEGKYDMLYNTISRWNANIGLTFHFGKGHREGYVY